MCYAADMDINEIVEAFGQDVKLPHGEIAARLGIMPTRMGAMSLAAALAPYGIKPRQLRWNGRRRHCYLKHELEVVANGKHLDANQRGPDMSHNVGVLQMRLKAANAKLDLYRKKAAAYDQLAHALKRLVETGLDL